MNLDDIRKQGNLDEHCPEQSCEWGGNYGLCKAHPTCELIHKELERLRKRVEELEAGLRPFAAIQGSWLGGYCVYYAHECDIKRAAALLADQSKETP